MGETTSSSLGSPLDRERPTMGDCRSRTLPYVAWEGRWDLILPNPGGWLKGSPNQVCPGL